MALFHDVLLNNITAKLGEYQGVRFEMGRTQTREDYDVVSTDVVWTETVAAVAD